MEKKMQPDKSERAWHDFSVEADGSRTHARQVDKCDRTDPDRSLTSHQKCDRRSGLRQGAYQIINRSSFNVVALHQQNTQFLHHIGTHIGGRSQKDRNTTAARTLLLLLSQNKLHTCIMVRGMLVVSLLWAVPAVDAFSSALFEPALKRTVPSIHEGVDVELPDFDELFGRIQQVSPLARQVIQGGTGPSGLAFIDDSRKCRDVLAAACPGPLG
jgi:hypothetical protein